MNRDNAKQDTPVELHISPWLPDMLKAFAKNGENYLNNHSRLNTQARDRFKRLFCEGGEWVDNQKMLWEELSKPPFDKHLFNIANLAFSIPGNWRYVKPLKRSVQVHRKEVREADGTIKITGKTVPTKGDSRPSKKIPQIVRTAKKLHGLLSNKPFLNEFFDSHRELSRFHDDLLLFEECIEKWNPYARDRQRNNEIFAGAGNFRPLKDPHVTYTCREFYLYFKGTFGKPHFSRIASIANLLFDKTLSYEDVSKMVLNLPN